MKIFSLTALNLGLASAYRVRESSFKKAGVNNDERQTGAIPDFEESSYVISEQEKEFLDKFYNPNADEEHKQEQPQLQQPAAVELTPKKADAGEAETENQDQDFVYQRPDSMDEVPNYTRKGQINVSGFLQQCRKSAPCREACSKKQSRELPFDDDTSLKTHLTGRIPDSFVYTAECQYCSFTCLKEEYKTREELRLRELPPIPKWAKCLAQNCRNFVAEQNQRGFYSCHYKCSMMDHLAVRGMKMDDITRFMRKMESSSEGDYSKLQGLNPMNYRKVEEGESPIVVPEFVASRDVIDRNIIVEED